jgi:KaiC/GvpD/RAD55 family RecA-like ATPase
MHLESLILNILLKDKAYLDKSIHYLQSDYFSSRPEKVVFECIKEFYEKYQKAPTADILKLSVDELVGLSDDEFKLTKDTLKSAVADQYEYDLKWMFDSTEKFCQEKAVYNAIMKSVKIISGDDKKTPMGAIPELLQSALAVTFDSKTGHDYFRDAQERYDFYHKGEVRIPCSIDLINKITSNGFPRKTLCLFMAPTGGGKSAIMSSLSCDFVRQGQNVLYITLELSEERVSERIDANMFNIPMGDVKKLPKDVFLDRVQKLDSKSHGRLIVKEYPTGTGSAAMFKTFINDLIAKEGFKPDVLVVDYMGITASDKYRNSSTANSYTTQKTVAEELRALAMELDMLVISAVQTNRSAYNASDFDIESISESAGIVMTADLLLGIIRTEELDELNQMMIKQLKNRFGDPNYYKRFVVGLDRARMKMYNIEQSDSSYSQPEQKNEPALDAARYATGAVASTEFDFD